MPTDAALLAEVPFFQFLDDHEREELSKQLDVVAFPVGQTIFNYGDPGDSLYVIRRGEVEIFFKDDTGSRILLETGNEGSLFGELSLLDGGPRTATAVVTADLEALRLDRPDLDAFLRKHPAAALDLLGAMGRRLRLTAEKLRHTASRNVNEEVEDRRTKVEKAADWIAEFSGSIPFLNLHLLFFAVWIGLNVPWMPGAPLFDPYPFGFLTMVVSLEAIVLSVFVLLSQNRQAAKDHVRSDVEYEVNLKAELEVAHLHEKLDKLSADSHALLDRIARAVERKP